MVHGSPDLGGVRKTDGRGGDRPPGLGRGSSLQLIGVSKVAACGGGFPAGGARALARETTGANRGSAARLRSTGSPFGPNTKRSMLAVTAATTTSSGCSVSQIVSDARVSRLDPIECRSNRFAMKCAPVEVPAAKQQSANNTHQVVSALVIVARSLHQSLSQRNALARLNPTNTPPSVALWSMRDWSHDVAKTARIAARTQGSLSLSSPKLVPESLLSKTLCKTRN